MFQKPVSISTPALDNCDINAKCSNSLGSYVCECGDNFHGNGRTCLPGDCIDSDCPLNKQCISPRSDCKCKAGFYRDESEECIDTNECEKENDCHRNAECSNTEGSYNCNCKPGFYGTGFDCLEGDCSDVSCQGNQTCIAPTSASCGCRKGLTKNGENCFDVDECGLGIDDCPRRSNCINTMGSHICDCYAGYDDTNCTNLDVMVCRVLDREFECTCKDGFDEHVNGTCTDIDECSRGLHKCQKNLDCVNNLGDYACEPPCEEGFERSYNGTCMDIDECTSNIHNCSSGPCVNIYGGFSCKE